MNDKRKNFLSVAITVAALLVVGEVPAITIDKYGGWLESAYVTWQPVNGAVGYEVSYSGNGIDKCITDVSLVRQYPDGLRADIPGLRAGEYTITIDALDNDGVLLESVTTPLVTVLPHNREGFAFDNGNVPGGYNLDGTPKDDARIIYVSANTVNTVSCEVKDNKGKATVYTGLGNILSAYGKGADKTPLIIRVIGTIASNEIDGLKDGNYINFQGRNNTTAMIENITLEGIGMDATLYGYGICFKRAHNIEIRNIGIMLFGDDAVSMDTDNSNIWLHNIDFFYGAPGSDADQVKGDGSIDMKYNSTSITISYNHFFDSGKVMGCGGTTGEDENLKITFHHNWFDHADSRCPRLHYTTAHIYNNYYDGVSVYSIGNTTESSAFVENNYFRNCNRPMMISGQGTDSYDESAGTYTLKGTFSGQDGGMTKAYNNIFAENIPRLVYYDEHPTQFDAYLADYREEVVPETVVSLKGAWPYSNFDTDASMYESVPDAPEEVPLVVTTYAGRMDGGDFKWNFDNTVDDADHEVNTALKSAIVGYTSSLLAIQGVDDITSGIVKNKADYNGKVTVYDLQGRKVSESVDMTSLPQGFYIVKAPGNTRKVLVK